MIGKDVAIAALSALCNANVTSTQQLTAQHGYSRGGYAGAPGQQQLLATAVVSTILDADQTCRVSRNSFHRLQSHLEGVTPAPGAVDEVDAPTGQSLMIDEDEFFDPRFDYDFTKLNDTITYYRGQERYERPCGWQRFAIKVLDKYNDGNAWLGNRYRSTQSVPGEWPVSYHGTSMDNAAGIIKGFYQAGQRERFGRGVYSTPYISEAEGYAKTFIHNGKRYKVILQNRINTRIRQKHNNDKYWLIPILAGTSREEEQQIVQNNIRPYGLLLRAI